MGVSLLMQSGTVVIWQRLVVVLVAQGFRRPLPTRSVFARLCLEFGNNSTFQVSPNRAGLSLSMIGWAASSSRTRSCFLGSLYGPYGRQGMMRFSIQRLLPQWLPPLALWLGFELSRMLTPTQSHWWIMAVAQWKLILVGSQVRMAG
ncbi:hypothetical protein LINGRAHAP2_LOCUS27251 [Linum grandiflorum]